MFYLYHQNNSGDVTKGRALNLVIEANNAREANKIAEENGAYFNGCDEGLDCRCCGDRWTAIGDWNDGDAEPSYYKGNYWIRKSERHELPLALIVYADGRKEERWS